MHFFPNLCHDSISVMKCTLESLGSLEGRSHEVDSSLYLHNMLQNCLQIPGIKS